MLQAYWTERGLAAADVEPGPVRPGWVRLRVAACGICGSDLHAYRGELRPAPGRVPGHEFVGTVEDGGPALADSLYAVEPRTHCGECDLCVAGKRHLCASGEFIGAHVPGGLAEVADVPRYTLYAVDPSVPPLIASIAEPLAVSLRAVHLARLEVDSRVLVLGAGSIGLMAGLLARERSGEVAISARHPHQQEAARHLGLTPLAEEAVDPWGKDREPDVVIETVGGTANTLAQAVRACRPAGRVVIAGIFTKPPALDALSVAVKELELVGSVMYGMGRRGPEFRAAVSVLPRHREELRLLQTHQFPLGDVNDAFACADDKRSGAIKVTVTMS